MSGYICKFCTPPYLRTYKWYDCLTPLHSVVITYLALGHLCYPENILHVALVNCYNCLPLGSRIGTLKKSLPYSLIRLCKDYKIVAVFENNWWNLTLVIIPDYTLAGLKEFHVLMPC